MITKIIIIIITVIIEAIIGFLIAKYPDKFMKDGKCSILMKLFIVIMISLMIISLTYLTISGVKG